MTSAAPAQRQRHPAGTRRLRPRTGRRAGSGLLACVAAAVLVTVPARVLMRLVALAAGHEVHFTWWATGGIALVFAVAMLPGALVAATTTVRRRWVLPAVGAVLLLVPATGIASDEVGSLSGVSGLGRAGVLAAGAGVYLCLAALPLVTLRLVDRWQPA